MRLQDRVWLALLREARMPQYYPCHLDSADFRQRIRLSDKVVF